MVRRAVDIKTGSEGHFWSDILEPIKQVGRQIVDFFSPSAEAGEVDDAYEISVELPGVKREDIDVSVADGILTVKGEKHSEREETGRSYYFSERSYGAFQRAFRLPSDADADRITADAEDGVLIVRIPRLAASERPERKIEIGKSKAGGTKSTGAKSAGAKSASAKGTGGRASG